MSIKKVPGHTMPGMGGLRAFDVTTVAAEAVISESDVATLLVAMKRVCDGAHAEV